MKDRWKDKNVDLSVLADCIVRFFAENLFAVSIAKSSGEYRIVARPKRFHGIAENIRVSVSGEPNDFSVKFTAGSHSRALVRYGTLTAILGGGYLSLKGLKSLEALEKLCKKFWKYVDEKVWQLAGSAAPAKST